MSIKSTAVSRAAIARNLTGRPLRRGGGGRAIVAVFAVAAACTVAACSTSSSSTTAASTPAPSQSQTTTAAPSATPTSQPTTSAPSSSAPAGGSGGGVTASPASAATVTQLEAVAGADHSNAHTCGYTTAADTLTSAKVTNNGWAIGTVTARNPQDQGNAQIVFKQDGTDWSAYACGSDFSGDNIPSTVLTAFNS